MPKSPVFPSHQRAWAPMGVSAALHVLLLVVSVGLSRPVTSAPVERSERPTVESPRIDMIYLPPPEAPPVLTPLSRPPQPPPPVRRSEPEPEPNAPPETRRSTGAETAGDDGAGEPQGSAPSPASEPAPPPEAEATLESEARRIFGRPRLAARAGVGPEAIRPMEAWAAERPERCIPRPAVPRDSAGPVQMGTAVGRIFRQDTGRPLADAHLHMIGTPYVAFTDGSGEYQFKFDLALVDNCRTQYVRVSAEGYESRLLVLLVGPNRSEDVLLRRR